MANIEKRETPDGKVTFRVKVRLRGYPVQSATPTSTVKRYAHLSEAHTHSIVASMNEKIFGTEDAA